MPSLDTNVLVRWLVGDDAKQSKIVQQVFESAKSKQLSLFIPCTVVLELEWVLRSRYQLDKTTLIETFAALLETRELQFQDEAAVEHALYLFRNGAAEFADCLHAGLASAAGHAPLLTFDLKAARMAEIELLDRSEPPASQ